MASTTFETTVDEKLDVEYGYIYCISCLTWNGRPYKDDECGIYNVGWSKEDPMTVITNIEEEANYPTKHNLEFAKRVKKPKQNGGIVHSILDDYDIRMDKGFEYFKCQKTQIYDLFNVISGSWFVEP